MPNILAFAALLSWPFIAASLFQRLSVERAVIWAIVAPFMLLPSATGIDLPAVPNMNKTTLPNVVLLILAASYASQKLRIMPESSGGKVLIVFMLGGPFLTALTNGDPLVFPAGYVPGLSPYDALSSVAFAIMLVAPFLVGRHCLGTASAHRELLKILVVGALAYSMPMLFEIRMSPQLHNWIYGFHPSSFGQQYRDGGFRPVVLMNHGLVVAFFTMYAVISAAALWRASKGSPDLVNGQWMAKLMFLLVLLVLCKSLASLIYALFGVILIAFLGVRMQLRVAAVLVVLAILYPILRGAELIPIEAMLDLARSYSEDRAGSLQFRFDHEADLLARAEERPLFGWGSWGRNHIHDPITGAQTSTADGYWVIMIGSFGWIGFLATFGLLALPILSMLGKARREGTEAIRPETAALSILLAINVVDLLPNATILPLTWLVAGSLLGYAEQREVAAPEAGKQEATITTPRRPRTIL